MGNHEHFYGICENKCLVPLNRPFMTWEFEIRSDQSSLLTSTSVIDAFIKARQIKITINQTSVVLNLSEINDHPVLIQKTFQSLHVNAEDFMRVYFEGRLVEEAEGSITFKYYRTIIRNNRLELEVEPATVTKFEFYY